MGMTFLYSVKVASLIFPSMDSTKVVWFQWMWE